MFCLHEFGIEWVSLVIFAYGTFANVEFHTVNDGVTARVGSGNIICMRQRFSCSIIARIGKFQIDRFSIYEC